ncbi:MAG: FAD-dependent oxidoreductase [Candidatus Latescibacterota bacterium]|jgi:NADPH-dependent 2,4-dienoyl-CoA reductase/sulfur reductase-like enzyme/rhodanese-related sulfurtransferase
MHIPAEKSDFVIIGGVAAGPKTAATLARRLPGATITLFQKEQHLSYAACGFPFFASGEVNSFEELLMTSYGVPRDVQFFGNTKGFTAVTSAEVTSINRETKMVTVKMLNTGEEVVHGYGRLVVATGAAPNAPPMPVPSSERVRPFTSPGDAAGFRELAQRGEVDSAVIVGGGFIGVELCEAVSDMWGISVRVYEKKPQLLPYMLDPDMADIVRRNLESDGVAVSTGADVEKIELDGDGKPVVHVAGAEPVKTDYVFLCLGVHPEVGLARECGLEIGETGGIVVDRRMRTSDPDIFAGGDCVQSRHRTSDRPVFLPMGSLANRHGRVIAENLAGSEAEFPGVLGAFVLRAFETNIGGVGLSEEAARRAGLDALSAWGSFPDRPDYNPEMKTIALKMVYESGTGRLLGLQAVGKGDICRRVDVFSSFLGRGASVHDLLDHEHCYAPPFSEALDPLHHMAGVAGAVGRGQRFVGPGRASIDELAATEAVLLDVREVEESKGAPLPAAVVEAAKRLVVIPLGELRSRLDELDRTDRIVVICRRGPRSYQAALTLGAAGFDHVTVAAAGLQALA